VSCRGFTPYLSLPDAGSYQLPLLPIGNFRWLSTVILKAVVLRRECEIATKQGAEGIGSTYSYYLEKMY